MFTHRVQVPGFDEERCYTVAGRVDDYPTGTQALWLRKQLSCSAGP